MSHKTNDLFHNFFFPYLMQDRAYPVDIDEALSTNEYINKIGKVTKSVIDDVTNLETRVEKLESDMPTSDEIIALAETVTKGHILKVKWLVDHFVDFDGETVTQHDLYDVFLKGAVILQMRVPEQMETEGYKNITAICCAATAPTDEDPEYSFNFVYLDHNWILRNTIKGNTLTYAISTNITSVNFDIWNEDNIILTPHFNSGKMYKNDTVYSLEDFYRDYKDKKNIYVKFEEYGFTRVFVLQAVEELAEDVARVIFYNTQFNGFDLIDWSVAGGVESITIDHKTYSGSSLNHIHLYCDGAGICYFDQKDSPDMEYLTFDEIKGIIENDTNIVFITNGYYSFYSKYYYHTAISQQDTDAIGFIGETQLNGHAYSWRIAINEHNEVTEDEIRLASNSQIVEVENSIKDLVVYKNDEVFIGKWVDNKPIYRQVITLTSGLAKDNPIQVIGNIPNFGKLMPTSGAVVTTTEGSSSSSDITMYATATGAVTVKQNFTSYPAQLDCIIEYTKDIDDTTAALGVGALGRMILGNS